MEVLRTNFAGFLKALALAVVMIALCAALVFFIRLQMDLERYGTEPSAQTKARPAATLVRAAGGVFATRSGALKEIRLRSGDTLYAGDRIQTGSGARAVIRVRGGARLTLEQNSLLQLTEDEGDGKSGELHLASGSIQLDSKDLTGISTLHTPRAVIALNTPDLAVIRPPAGMPPEHGYLAGLAKSWFPLPESKEAIKSVRILEHARAACARKESAACRKAQARAWRELLALRESSGGQQRVALDISIGKTGAERIAVKSGAVSITTQSRTLRVSQGEDLNLDGAMPTRKSITAESLLAMVPRIPEKSAVPEPQPEPPPSAAPKPKDRGESVYFEIDSIEWQ